MNLKRSGTDLVSNFKNCTLSQYSKLGQVVVIQYFSIKIKV